MYHTYQEPVTIKEAGFARVRQARHHACRTGENEEVRTFGLRFYGRVSCADINSRVFLTVDSYSRVNLNSLLKAPVQ